MSDLTIATLLPIWSGSSSHELASTAASPATSAACGYDRAPPDRVTPLLLPAPHLLPHSLHADTVPALTAAALRLQIRGAEAARAG